ncbi:AMP-binding protein [Nocardia takedensis]
MRARTLVDLLEALRSSAHGVTFVESGRTVAHRDLPDLARPVTGALAARGVGSGAVVGLLAPPGPHWLAGFFGAIGAGAAIATLPAPPLVLDAKTLADRLVPIIRTGGVEVVAASGPALRIATALAERVPTLTVLDLAAPGDTAADPSPVDPDSLAVVQFSSGSTADPKGVTLTHRQFLAGVAAIVDHIALTPADVMVQWVPLFHDMGLVTLMTGLLTPNDTHVFDPLTFVKTPEAILRHLAEGRGTVTDGPNFSFARLIAAAADAFEPGARPLTHWRLALNGAEAVRPETVREFARVFGPLGVPASTMAPCYGMAEATLAVTLPRPGDRPRSITLDRDALVPGLPAVPVAADAPRARELFAVGVPVPGLDLRITDLDGTPLPDGHVGEIRLRGEAVTTGYLRAGELVAARDAEGWLRTGDLGLLDAGELVIVGRLKEMIVVQGRNFFPEDVEEAARDVAGIHRGHCVAVADTEAERILIVAETAHAPASPEAAALVSAIRGAVSRALSLAAVTVRLVPPATLPRTTSGKWRRSAIAELTLSTEMSSPGV